MAARSSKVIARFDGACAHAEETRAIRKNTQDPGLNLRCMEETLSAARRDPAKSRMSPLLKITRYYVSPDHSIFPVLSWARETAGDPYRNIVMLSPACDHTGAICRLRAHSQFAKAMAIVTTRTIPSPRLMRDASKATNKTPSVANKFPAGRR